MSDLDPAKESRKSELVDALSLLFGGTRGASIFVVAVLVVGSLVTLYAQYFIGSLDDPSSVILALPELDQKLIEVELDGQNKFETNNGFVRFDHLKPGKHSIAIFSAEKRIAYRQFELASGDEVELTLDYFNISSNPVFQEYNLNLEVPLQQVDVLVDPGHGGQDPGALGRLAGVSFFEKDLVLDFSIELANALNSRGVSSALTRVDDSFLSLEKRATIARQTCEHLFISIHADSHVDSEKSGTSVFLLSDKSREREVIKIRTENGEDDTVVAQRFMENMDKAQRVAQEILSAIDKSESKLHIPLYSKKPEKAGFIVLKASDSCPSLLLELGFINNDTDSARLLLPFYKRQYVQIVADAISGAL